MYIPTAVLTQGAVASAPDPVFDVFGTPDTAFEFNTSSLAGLTALSTTPDVEDADSSVPGCYFLRDDATGESVCGRYASAPAAPFTAITRLTDHTVRENFNIAGILIGVSTPGVFDFWTRHYTSGMNTVLFNCPSPTDITTPGISQFITDLNINYFAIRVNSGTSVDYLWSREGSVWTRQVSARNPSFTISVVGVAIAAIDANNCAAAFDYLRIWNSALTFPGVP